MTSYKQLISLTAIFSLLFLAVFRLAAQSNPAAKTAEPGFAVLELFTSEGCSSCPPAEALLEKIDQSSAGKSVYVLAYHVDYWDRLGWKDPFSRHSFSTRQITYSKTLSGQVYTPQLVINGTKEGVGSDLAYLNKGIKQALSEQPVASLAVDVKLSSGAASAQYRIQGDSRNTKLVMAIVQKHATSVVTRGENKGRTLSHAAIVHDLKFIPIGVNKKGMANIKLPEGFNQKDWYIVAFIQNTQTGAIAAASRAKIIN